MRIYMKKLSLKLLFSSIVLINAYATDVVVTTTLGPIDLVVNTTKTPTDGNAYNTVTLGGTINIGDTTTGNITLASSVFNAAVSALGVNEFIPLTLDKNSLLHAGQLTQLGNAGDNIISCQSANSSNNPDITITAVEGTGGLKRHIELMASGDIKVASQSINVPSNGSHNVLTVDQNGNITTSDQSSVIILGDNYTGGGKNFITVDNSINQTGVILDTSHITASTNNIKLNAGSNQINFVFGSSSSNSYALLAVDLDGNLKKLSATDPIVCGSLTAAGSAGESVNFGVSAGNTFLLSDTTNTEIKTKSGSSIVFDSADHITTISSDLSFAPSVTTALALNSSNNLVTTDHASIYLLGNNASSSNNYITVDNSASNPTGLVLNGALKITGLPGVSALASGETAALTIDSNGSIGIVISDITKKENIKELEIGDDFYSIRPISYTIKGKENSATEFGFSAQALRGTSYEQAIIWGRDGEPVSIDYKSIFTAAISKFIETRKELFNKIEQLESELYKKDEAIVFLKEQISELQIQSAQLEVLIRSLLK